MSEKSTILKEFSQKNDLIYKQMITLEEAAQGCQKSFVIQRLELCSTCQGSGIKCTPCQGQNEF